MLKINRNTAILEVVEPAICVDLIPMLRYGRVKFLPALKDDIGKLVTS